MKVGNCQLQALVDKGANYNFIKDTLVSCLIRRTETPRNGTPEIPVNISGHFHDVHFLVLKELRLPIVLELMEWFVKQGTFICRCVAHGHNPRRTIHWGRKNTTVNVAKNNGLEAKNGLRLENREEFKALLNQFVQVFHKVYPLTTTPSTTHKIELTDSRPVNLPSYGYSPETKRLIQTQVSEMKAVGIIELSTSPYSSPVVILRKKDCQPRFCVDYGQVNSQHHHGDIAYKPKPYGISTPRKSLQHWS